jgi:hypothetical protein
VIPAAAPTDLEVFKKVVLREEGFPAYASGGDCYTVQPSGVLFLSGSANV